MFDFDNDILHQNVIFLRKFIPDIEEKLCSVEVKSNYRVMSSENGYPVLAKNGVLLNNSENPIQENISVFESVPQNDKNVYIICGLELGHLLNFFNDNCKGYIIVFEDDLEIIKYTMSKVSLIKILAMPKVALVTNKEELENYINHIKLLDRLGDFYVLANEYYSENYIDKIKSIRELYCNNI